MRKAENRKWIAWLFLLLYLCCVLYITLLSRGDSVKRIFRMDVFASWRMWLGGNAARGRPILQNIALFVPMGFFLTQVLSGRKYRFPAAVLLGFAVSLLIETVQYHTGRGWFDAEDLFNNTLWAAIGSGLFCAADRIMGTRKAGQVACEVLSVLLILAGIVGCLQMKMQNLDNYLFGWIRR